MPLRVPRAFYLELFLVITAFGAGHLVGRGLAPACPPPLKPDSLSGFIDTLERAGAGDWRIARYVAVPGKPYRAAASFYTPGLALEYSGNGATLGDALLAIQQAMSQRAPAAR